MSYWLRLFTPGSTHKKSARLIAIAWTLLILILCFMPAREIPDIKVPFIDKWTHFVLFAGFSMAWLCAWPSLKWYRLLLVFLASVLFGSLIEIFQGILVFLGRSCELMDAVADGVGGLLGVIIFALLARVAKARKL